MTIRELANEAAKAGKLDARIVIRNGKDEHDANLVTFLYKTDSNIVTCQKLFIGSRPIVIIE